VCTKSDSLKHFFGWLRNGDNQTMTLLDSGLRRNDEQNSNSIELDNP
jgi:hypothetical protein